MSMGPESLVTSAPGEHGHAPLEGMQKPWRFEAFTLEKFELLLDTELRVSVNMMNVQVSNDMTSDKHPFNGYFSRLPYAAFLVSF